MLFSTRAYPCLLFMRRLHAHSFTSVRLSQLVDQVASRLLIFQECSSIGLWRFYSSCLTITHLYIYVHTYTHSCILKSLASVVFYLFKYMHIRMYIFRGMHVHTYVSPFISLSSVSLCGFVRFVDQCCCMPGCLVVWVSVCVASVLSAPSARLRLLAH